MINQHTIRWEQCEKRLALSAMPWNPWGDTQGDYCDASGTHDLHASIEPPASIGPHPLPGSATYGPSQHSDVPVFPMSSATGNGIGAGQQHYGLTGAGQTVAIIDSGIAFDHMALGHGFGPGYRVVGGWDFAENDARPYDDAPAGFHGTHVAGIIGASDGQRTGVAPGVDLVALRVFDDAGRGELSWAESALQWVHQNRFAFENPITTVNLSMGSTWNSNSIPTWGTLEDELLQLQHDGIVVVASAGNAFQQNKTPGLSYPAVSPNVIPVSSVDADGRLSDFSQRDTRSIAAPGRSIESTVPDYFYGRDGDPNDWAVSTGTSMAAPHITGAAVLIREAMELIGAPNITPQSIYETMRSTASSVWDAITNQSYSSLDLQRAIDSILPDDNVGEELQSGMQLSMQSSWKTDGWINHLGDRDVYRLNPSQAGTLSINLESNQLDNELVSFIRAGHESTLSLVNGRATIPVLAGESLGIAISDSNSIGQFQLNWSFEASSSNTINPSVPTINNPVQLGRIDVLDRDLVGGATYAVTAANSGLLSIVVEADNPVGGGLQAKVVGGSSAQTFEDSTIENGHWRLDLEVTAGQTVSFVVPGGQTRDVSIVNLVKLSNGQLTINGTSESDQLAISFADGISTTVSGIAYYFDASQVRSIEIDGRQSNDTISIVGSSGADKIEMRPGLSTFESLNLRAQLVGVENINFQGGGGPDRAYMYDASTDDRLNIWPNKAELTGVGYSFFVNQTDRIFVHALQGGNDSAFVFDSSGDDTLSVRPQFTSLTGTGFFSYVSGFERVYAYSSEGGVDAAQLYDSAGDDLFSTSGEVTSIVGPGYSTFARGYERVEAFSSAGGTDRASIYAPIGGQLTSGTDFVGMQTVERVSLARTFDRVETFVGGTIVPTPQYSVHTASISGAEEIPTAVDSIYSLLPLQAEAPETSIAQEARVHHADSLSDILDAEIKERFPLRTISSLDRGEVTASPLDFIRIGDERALLDSLFATYDEQS